MAINPSFLAKNLYGKLSDLNLSSVNKYFEVSILKSIDTQDLDSSDISMQISPLGKLIQNKTASFEMAFDKIKNWINEGYQVIISTHTMTQAARLQSLLHTKDIFSTVQNDTQNWIWNLHNEKPVTQKKVLLYYL